MFNEFKNLFSKQFSKMKNFDSEKNNERLDFTKKNANFSTDLDDKISSSKSRISSIRKSIQNTKL